MATLLTFLGVAGIILGLYSLLVVGPERRERRRLRARLSAALSSPAKDAAVAHDLLLPGAGDARRPGAPWTLRPLYEAAARLTRLRDQAGMSITVRTIGLLMAAAAGVVMAVAWLLGTGAVATLALGAAASLIPIVALLRARAARLRKFEALLPEATDIIARALRTGQTLPSALQMVGDELRDPVGAEFRLLHEHFRFGAPLPDVLHQLAERVPLVDTRFLVTAILLQRETGGNLPELLDNLATVVRDRFRVRRKVRSVTAHGRLSGWILSAMPPAIGLLLLAIRPDYMQMLVTDSLGRHLLAGAFVLEGTGVLIIRRLVRVEY